MAKKKDNLKGMNAGELTKKLAEVREELRKVHFMAVGAKTKNVKEGAALKKQIARVLTEMSAQAIS
jgi:ribosomal protein L29